MNVVKKITALSLAALMAGSMAACSVGQDTVWVAKYGDTTVPSGIYLAQVVGQYSVAVNKLPEDVKDPMKEKVDGTPLPDFVIAEAKKELSKYIAIEQNFDEMGLTLTPEEIESDTATVNQYWDFTMNPYDPSSKTLGETYTLSGISKESYLQSFLNDTKRTKIFNAIYGPGGTEEVSESALKEKFSSDVAKIMMMPLTFSSSEDAQKKADTDKQTRDLIDKYYKLAKDGGNMEDLVYEAEKEATKNEELEKPAAGTSFNFVTKEQSPYADNVTDAIFNAKLGEPTVVETETSIYLFVRYDVNENATDFTARKGAMLNLLKQDEFNERLQKWADELPGVTYNDAAFKRYTLKKLKLD